MADKKNDPATDLNDLLDDFDSVSEEVAAAPAVEEEVEPEVPAEELKVNTKPAEPVETPEAKRIRELKEELEKPAPVVLNPTDVEGKPLPEEELTPEQREIRELEDRLAKKKAKELENAPEQFDTTQGKETILIHFVEDGFTAQGRSWYKGMEVEFVVGSRAYNDTKDREGKTWLTLTESEQIQKYGQTFFRPGPWPGTPYTDDEALAAERKRNRAAPILTS